MLSKNKIILISVIFFTLIIGISVFFIIRQNEYSATLNIEATPLSSKITIDNNNTQQGITKIKPGNVTIEISLNGFITYTKTVTVNSGETKYIGAILESNSSETSNWYSNHPEDQKMSEKISSKQFDIKSEEQLNLEPFLKEIPYIGAGFEFKIDYGPSATDPNKITIFIQAATQTARDDALTWIKSRGYDPAKLDIVYTS